MNKKQKIIAWIGVIMIFMMSLIPPWKMIADEPSVSQEFPAGYHPIFAPPLPDEEDPYSPVLDLTRLGVQWITMLFIMAAALYITHEKDESESDDEDVF